VGWIGGGSSGWQTSNSAPSYGSGEAYFNYPYGVYVDSSGNIYVADGNNFRIDKWNSSGQVVGWIGGGSSGWQMSNSAPSSGSGEAYFTVPKGVYVDASGNIYVADDENYRICKWNSSGQVVGWIGGGNSGWQTNSTASAGSGEAYFYDPYDVYVDSSSNIYAADWDNSRICKWNSSGVVQGWVGGGYSGWQTSNSAPSSGSGEAYFAGPKGVYIDGSGNIYIADLLNNRICKWH
jgi:hypothetical protein